MPHDDPRPASPAVRVVVAILLIAPFVVYLAVPSYARITPRLAGFPFFYWWQLLWVIITAVFVGARVPAHAPVAPRVRRGRRVMGDVNGVELAIFVGCLRPRHGDGLHGRALAARADPHAPGRVGARRAQLRHLHHLVPARRRPLHRVHLHRGPRGGLRRRRHGLLGPPVRRDRLPDRVPDRPAPVVGRARPRLRHDGRLRTRPVRLPVARPGRRRHRDHGDDALHRAPARRHPGRADGDRADRLRARQGPAAAHRVRAAGRLHLHLGPARAGADRVRQGHPDLRCDHRRRRLSPDEARRLAARLRQRAGRAWPGPTRRPGSPPARSSPAR